MDVRDNGKVRIEIRETDDPGCYSVLAMQNNDLKEGVFGAHDKDEVLAEASRLFDKYIIG